MTTTHKNLRSSNYGVNRRREAVSPSKPGTSSHSNLPKQYSKIGATGTKKYRRQENSQLRDSYHQKLRGEALNQSRGNVIDIKKLRGSGYSYRKINSNKPGSNQRKFFK